MESEALSWVEEDLVLLFEFCFRAVDDARRERRGAVCRSSSSESFVASSDSESAEPEIEMSESSLVVGLSFFDFFFFFSGTPLV